MFGIKAEHDAKRRMCEKRKQNKESCLEVPGPWEDHRKLSWIWEGAGRDPDSSTGLLTWGCTIEIHLTQIQSADHLLYTSIMGWMGKVESTGTMITWRGGCIKGGDAAHSHIFWMQSVVVDWAWWCWGTRGFSSSHRRFTSLWRVTGKAATRPCFEIQQ